jgi:hypothetical protein
MLLFHVKKTFLVSGQKGLRYVSWQKSDAYSLRAVFVDLFCELRVVDDFVDGVLDAGNAGEVRAFQ